MLDMHQFTYNDWVVKDKTDAKSVKGFSDDAAY